MGKQPNLAYSDMHWSKYDIFYKIRSAQTYMQVKYIIEHTNPRLDHI